LYHHTAKKNKKMIKLKKFQNLKQNLQTFIGYSNFVIRVKHRNVVTKILTKFSSSQKLKLKILQLMLT